LPGYFFASVFLGQGIYSIDMLILPGPYTDLGTLTIHATVDLTDPFPFTLLESIEDTGSLNTDGPFALIPPADTFPYSLASSDSFRLTTRVLNASNSVRILLVVKVNVPDESIFPGMIFDVTYAD